MQGVLEEALSRLLGLVPAPSLTVAGRTDAGVHARGQVAHVDVPVPAWRAAASSLARRLDRVLPADVLVRSVAPAPPGFDARFSALWRRYTYRVCDSRAHLDPVRRTDTLWHPRPLSLDRMNEAARACLGEHDFAAFCRPRRGASTVRDVRELRWERAGPGVAVGTVVADAFCHNMVRALTGALLAVGDGRKAPGWLETVLAGRVRDPAVVVAPPHPLCLEEVRYPPDSELADRAARTRQARGAGRAGA